jgi:hypothetical protein
VRRPNGHAKAAAEIDVGSVLDDPAGTCELFVDVLAGVGFGQHRVGGSRGWRAESFLPRYA